jgi:tetratricopeptide (TPR) repeat protein/4-amino-4-deoxy-L-arabinose transferase-like glycosyltransferase
MPRVKKSAAFSGPALVIFAVALALRLAHLWFVQESPFGDVLLGDAHSYDVWAREIAGGNWVGTGVFYQAPLYPYFLGAIYTLRRSLLLVRVCQALVGAGACVLLGYAAYRLFDRAVGLAAGLILACCAPVLFFGALVQKSVLDIFFLCLLLALLSTLAAGQSEPSPLPARPRSKRPPSAPLPTEDERWRWLGVGIALGALSLTRENALLFVPVLLAWVYLRPASAMPRARAVAFFVAGLAVVLLPVGVRNRVVGGEFYLTTAQSGPNFFIGNNANADGAYIPLRLGRGSPEYERVDATDLASQAAGRPLSPGEISSYWTGRALDYIRAQPVDWLALEGRKFRLLWNAAEVVDTEGQESHADYSPILRVAGYLTHFGVLVPLAVLGIWLTWGDRGRLWWLHAMFGAYALSVMAFYVVARYRLPLAPFVIVFASVTLVRGRRLLRIRPRRQLAAAVFVVATVTVFCNWRAVSAAEMSAVTYHNLGTTLQEEGRFDEAVTAYRRAVALDAAYVPALNGLGSALRQDGKLDEAIHELEAAVRLRPDFADARYNLANALSERGRLSEAIALYEELLERRPDAVDAQANVDVRSNLGIALADVGQLDEAIDQFRKALVLAPETARPHYNLGHALLARGDAVAAAAALSRAVELDPAFVPARDDLAGAYMAGQRLDLAVEQYREVVRLSPGNAEAHNNLGIALGSLGRLGEALEEFRSALQVNPGFAEAQANLRMALAAQSSQDSAGRPVRSR